MEAGNITLGNFPATKHAAEFYTQTMSILDPIIHVRLVIFLENVSIVFLMFLYATTKWPFGYWLKANLK